MSDNLISGLGAVLSVSTGAPATENEAGYEALTFTAVGEVTEIPAYGSNFDVVTHVPLATGITVKRKGARNNGSMSIPMALDYGDAGQDIVRTAAASLSDIISVKVEYVDGTAEYFRAIVTSFTRGASVGSVVTATVNFEITSPIVTVEA